MSIFYDITIQLKGIGKLYYDIDGKAFLYNSAKNEFKEITIYSPEQFKPNVRFYYGDILLGDKEKSKEELSSLDNVLIYSVKVGESITNGKSIPILRYGFINEKGFAITHATYDRVQAFINGHATVFIDGQWCQIGLLGYPIINGNPFMKAEFVFGIQGINNKANEFNFCCTDGKYGLINKYQHLCIPCEYDRISIKKDSSHRISYVELEKDGYCSVAIIEGNSVCNVLNYSPKSIKAFLNQYGEGFLVIERTFKTDKKEFVRQGLLNRGGLQILESEFDKIDIVSEVFRMKNCADQEINSFAIVSKDDNKRLLLISETGAKVIIDDCSDIKYGEGYDEKSREKLYYAIINGKTLRIFMHEDSQKNHEMENILCADISPSHNNKIDSIYFTYDGYHPNNYIAVVVGDKTKLCDFNGEEVIPLVIPTEYHVETDTFSEGIVGVSIVKEETNSNGEIEEETYYSYINSEGVLLTDFKYKAISKFENGRALAYYQKYTDCADELDTNGNLIQMKSFCDNYNPLDNWRDYIGDAFEGDSSAYWNID